jgi:hypothetical protein
VVQVVVLTVLVAVEPVAIEHLPVRQVAAQAQNLN